VVYGVESGLIPVPPGRGTPTAGTVSGAAPPALVPAGATKIVSDPLTARKVWQPVADARHQTTCKLDGRLLVTKRSDGPYRCKGLDTNVRNPTVLVDVTLLTPGACAGLWFRFDGASDGAGYALQVCPDAFHLVIHGAGGTDDIRQLQAFRLDDQIPLKTPTRVAVSAQGPDMRFYRAGQQVGEWRDGTFHTGRVVLGIFPLGGGPPYEVAFTQVEVWNSRG
jgi:hypothetical protein